MTKYCPAHSTVQLRAGDFCHRCREDYIRYENSKTVPNPASATQTKSALELRQAIEGAKHDGGKPRWSLLPLAAVKEVIGVLEFGAKKYDVDNWQKVPDARTRYYDAAMRHLTAWREGEQNDPESGLHHLAHAGCCVLFLLWFEVKA